MKVLQHNIQSLPKNLNTLNFYLNNNDISVSLLSEIFKYENNMRIPNYNIITKTRQDQYGGVAILIKNHILFKKIKFVTNFDLVIIQTTNLRINYTLASIYIPPNTRIGTFKLEVQRIFDFLENMPNVIIGGDLNARSTSFGDSTSNAKGIFLQDIISNTNFKILNDGSTTFHRFNDEARQSSVLDLTFTNCNQQFTWPAINIPISKSHHKTIIFDNHQIMNQLKCKFLDRKQLCKDLSKIKLTSNIDEIHTLINTEIQKCTRFVTKRIPKYWWNDSLKPIFRRFCAARQKCNKFHSPENFLQYLQAKDEWETAVRDAKNKSWNEKIQTINKNGCTKDFWSLVKNLKKINEPRQLPVNWNEEQQLKYLKYLQSHCKTSHLQLSSISIVHPEEYLSRPFEMSELELVLSNKKKSTSAGLDGITYDHIKALSNFSREKLLEALNSHWHSSTIKEEWRSIKIVPIPKKGMDHDLVENFRPIALISVILKLMSLILKERLVQHLNDTNFLPTRTFAYRKHMSATTLLNELIHTITLRKQEGSKVTAVVTDISKAYDCVLLQKLHETLDKSNTPNRIKLWILNYLSSRRLVIGNQDVEVHGGLPQGCCLSPILFDMYTTVLHTIEDKDTYVFQYADDFIIISIGDTFEQSVLNLNTKLSAFKTICNNLNFDFNPAKTRSINFAKGSKKPINVQISNTQIEQVTTIKILGRDISSSLSIAQHYRRIKCESINPSNALKMITTVKAGLHPNISLNTYKSIIRSKGEYARTTSCGAPPSVENTIERFQNQHLRRCLGLPRDTPNHILYHMASELPPKFRSFWLTAKEIVSTYINIYQPEKFQELLQNSPPLKTSYSFCYRKFKVILNSIQTPEKVTSSKKLKVHSDLYGNFNQSKGQISPLVIRSNYAELVSKYKAENYAIISTDASISTLHDKSGIGIFDVKTLSIYN